MLPALSVMRPFVEGVILGDRRGPFLRREFFWDKFLILANYKSAKIAPLLGLKLCHFKEHNIIL